MRESNPIAAKGDVSPNWRRRKPDRDRVRESTARGLPGDLRLWTRELNYAPGRVHDTVPDAWSRGADPIELRKPPVDFGRASAFDIAWHSVMVVYRPRSGKWHPSSPAAGNSETWTTRHSGWSARTRVRMRALMRWTSQPSSLRDTNWRYGSG